MSPLVIVWGIMLRQLVFALTHFRIREPIATDQKSDALPSVSVCIAARNEMHVMTDCLESVLASTYPKLEVIVLDDHSEDTTSTLVKAFAREGVRFVEGKSLPNGWLGKNHALQGLLDEASGHYVLFMDVDARMAPDTIHQMVTYMQNERAAMLSVLPRREDGWRASVFFSPLRYFWEIMFHRQATPATASSAWMIERKVLVDECDGFHELKTVIQPESRLSALLMPQNRYRFLIGTQALGLTYAKKWRSQTDTSIRLLYPLLGSQVLVSIFALFGLLCLLIPFILLAQTIQIGWTFMQTFSAAIAGAYIVLYGIYAAHMWRRGWWLGALLWPVLLLQEFLLIVISAERYILKTVTWKGRSVSIPEVKTT